MYQSLKVKTHIITFNIYLLEYIFAMFESVENEL